MTEVGVPATSCSALSAEMAEPLAGTAASALTWLCIEQPGPYGPDALVESHFDHAIGVELARRAAGSGVRIQLIRRPGRHADEHHEISRRRVFLAHTRPGATWLQQAHVADPADLLDLDLAAVGAGVRPAFGRPYDGPLFLVCTNGRRDVCCALFGRPIVRELAQRYGEAVWETTHTGGHRFAPTGVLLPTGYLYGRLDIGFAEHVLARARAGQVVTDRCRGRSTWSPAGQVAELVAREVSGEAGPDALLVADDEHPAANGAAGRTGAAGGSGAADWRVRVSVAESGRSWWVRGREETLEPARRTSCAKAPVVPTANVATGISEIAPEPVHH